MADPRVRHIPLSAVIAYLPCLCNHVLSLQLHTIKFQHSLFPHLKFSLISAVIKFYISEQLKNYNHEKLQRKHIKTRY
jgi:hypothetical protein